MAKTLSTMLELGTPAPDFSLTDVTTGQAISLESFSGDKALLVMFICRHCPFVKHVQTEFARIGSDYRAKGLGVVAISSNDIESHPEDGPEHLKEMAAELGFTFPYLFDETQEVAKAYTAACTPDFFLFDAGRTLAYRGQLDDSRPESGIPVTGRDLRLAIEATLAGRPVDDDQAPSLGCNINGAGERAQLLRIRDTPLFLTNSKAARGPFSFSDKAPRIPL
jgi:peroxiredoxin